MEGQKNDIEKSYESRLFRHPQSVRTGGQDRESVNFSIGQPDFDVPDALKEVAIDAIRKETTVIRLPRASPSSGKRSWITSRGPRAKNSSPTK